MDNQNDTFMNHGEAVVKSSEADSSLQSLSQDLLQQALEEVSHSPHQEHQVKEEPGIFEQLLAAPNVPTIDISDLDHLNTSSADLQEAAAAGHLVTSGDLDKVKIEAPPPLSSLADMTQLPSQHVKDPVLTHASHGGITVTRSSAVQSMTIPAPVQVAAPVVFIPTFQADGSVAYTVQHGQGTNYPHAISIAQQHQQHTLLNQKIVAPPILPKQSVRNPGIKPKVILPKSSQQNIRKVPHPAPLLSAQTTKITPAATSASLSIAKQSFLVAPKPAFVGQVNVKSPDKQNKLPAILKRPEPIVRKVQLVVGNEGQSKNIDIMTSAKGEVSISTDQPLTQVEIKHLQSIIQHQREEREKGIIADSSEKQVYRVVYPTQVQQNKIQKTSAAIETVNLEDDPDNSEADITEDDQTFSVAAMVREISKRGRGKVRSRGRPRKGTPKVINEKKVYSELRKEFGLREVKVKEFGLVEEEDENNKFGNNLPSSSSNSSSRTRSGRLSRPPPRIRKPDQENNQAEDDNDEISIVDIVDAATQVGTATTGAITNMNIAPPPKVELDNIPQIDDIPLPNRRNFVPPAKYVCKVCGKLYLGDKKIAKHLKHFPSHEFATPEPPLHPVVKETKKSLSFDSYVADCEPNKFMDQVGAKIFKSFSLWDLLVNKTISKRLGTVESLTSLLADMQAIVMELKNLVEQCLSCERTNEDSFRVTLTPIMSSVLGLSHSGSVTRYVLPYTQIPQHYHKLLNFPTGLKTGNIVSSSSDPALMSPESTTSMIHLEEENSQMSLSSDTLDQPLCDKVVLEDNLGARPLDMDDETQDSSLTAPSPVLNLKRTRHRLDSESPPPPSQTPDFLSQGDDSNMSTISTTVTEPSDQGQVIPTKRIRSTTAADTNISSQMDSVHTKLPSFSSIINGSPKENVPSDVEQAEDDTHNNLPALHRVDENSLSTVTQSNEIFNTTESCAPPTFEPSFAEATSSITNTENTVLKIQSNRISCLSQETFGVTTNRGEPLGGSAPVSPRVSYGPVSGSYSRRCSLDNINRTASEDMLLGLASKLQTSSSIMDIQLSSIHEESVANFDKQQSNRSNHSFRVENNSTTGTTTEYKQTSEYTATGTDSMFVTSQYQPDTNTSSWTSSGAVISRSEAVTQGQTTFIQSNETNKMVTDHKVTVSNSFEPEVFSHVPVTSSDLDQSLIAVKPGILKVTSKPQPCSYHGGNSTNVTNVTFSDELNHPIPSVSPAKDFKDIDLKRQNPTPPSESQSSSIFSDLESVLNEATGFSFDTDLPGGSRCQIKTPDKLLASVPPAAIMDKKSTLTFDNILEFDKQNHVNSTVSEADNNIPDISQNMLPSSDNFQFSNSSGDKDN